MPRDSADLGDELPSAKVWVNTKSGAYHCPGTRYYGATKVGKYVAEVAARESGYRPANGKPCGSTVFPLGERALAAQAPSRASDCGYDRWPVKVLRDRDAARVGRDTVRTTIRELNAIPIPEIPYPRDRRISPQELTIYKVSAFVEEIRVEDDRDWHLILSDPEDRRHTIIVEIPAPECVAGTAYGPAYKSARDSLRRVPRRGLVEVLGVGFFDYIHTQRDMARNGFELHPVLSLRPLATPSVSP